MDTSVDGERLPSNVSDRISDAIVRLDDSFEYSYVNSRAEELLDTTEGELLGTDIWEAFPDATDTVAENKLKDARETGKQQRFERYNENLDRWFEVRIYPEEVGLSLFFTDITAQKERGRSLETVRQRFEQFAGSVEHAFFLVTRDYSETLYVNSAVERLYGITLKEAEADPTTWLRHVHPGDKERLAESIRTQESGPTEWPIEQEFRVQHPNRGRRWLRVRLEIAEEGPDQRDRIAGVATDITERKERDQELQQSKQIIENATDIATIIDPDGTITYVSPAVERVLGYDPEELIGNDGFAYQPPETSEVVANAIEEVLNNPTETRTVQTRFRRADGSWCWIESTLRNRVEDDIIDGILVSSRDITERKEQQQELERTSQFLKDTQEVANIGGWEVSLQSEMMRWSDEVYRIHGLPLDANPTPEEGIEFYHPDDRDTIREAFDRLTAEGEPYDLELRIVTVDDTVRWVRTRGEPKYENGDIIGVRGTFQDITERKERERELRQSKERIRALFDEAPAEIHVHDADGEILDVNRAAIDELGYSREDLLSKSVSDIVVGKSQSELQDIWSNVSEGAYYQSESRHRRADGTTYPIEVFVNKISHEGTDHFIAICRNISTRKRQAESLAEIHTASQDLVRAPNQDTLVRRLVSAADAVLDVDAATVYQFDEVQNVLSPVESLEHTESWPEPAAIEPGSGVRWDAFATETSRLVEAEFTQYLQDAPPGTRLAVVPIGEFGLLQCVSSNADGFNEQQLELIETLVANAEAVLTRVEKERELEHRETELQKQTAQLERLDSINKQVRRITQRLLNQRTVQDVFSTVCAGLAELDQYELVWIGNQGESVVTPIATDGQSSYLDANAPFEIGSHPDTDAAGRTAETGEVTAIQRVATELHDGGWQADALAQDLLSVASVPIEYRGVPYGILTAYANQTDAFEENTLDILRECGEAVAQVCHQIEQEGARRRGEVTEVTFSVEEPQTPFLSFIHAIDGQASVFKIVHRPEMTRVYCRLEVPSGTDIEQTATAISGFQSLHRIEKTRYRCDVDPPAQDIFQTIVNSGGAVETVAATDDNPVTITASFPETGCSSNVLSTVTQQYGSVAITETQSAESTGYFIPDLFADLTDRQYDALETAFQQGYFSWPRQSTGEEIAAEMNIAPSTFTEHLRRAEASIVNKLMTYRTRGDR